MKRLAIVIALTCALADNCFRQETFHLFLLHHHRAFGNRG